MSEQPPYAPGPQQPGPQQPGPQQSQQPYNPYGNQPHPGGYVPYPGPQAPYGANQPKSNTTRNVLLIVAAVVVLFCGGIITAIVVIINNASDAFDEAFDDEYRGNRDAPLTVEEGRAFSIREYDYQDGWSLAATDGFDDAITGLQVVNGRSDREADRLTLTFTFLDGTTVLGDVRCSSPAAVAPGRGAAMECFGDTPDAGTYDTIEVYDNALFE